MLINGEQVKITGNALQEALSEAAGKPILYQRFDDALLNENDFLGRLAAVIDDGRGAGNADIHALRNEFGHLLSLKEWLDGPGREAFRAALSTNSSQVKLR